jgi:hypothetical protein
MRAYRGTNPLVGTTVAKDPRLYIPDDGLLPDADRAKRLGDVLDRHAAESEAAMAEGKKIGERPGTKTLDYIALGLLLAPPAVVVEMYMKEEPINWRKTAIVTVVCWVAGGLAVLASHGWQSWRSSDWRILPYLISLEGKFWGKAAIIAICIGGALALSSILSNNPSVPPPVNGFTEQQVNEKIEAATASLGLQLSAAIKGQEDLGRENDRLRKLLSAAPSGAPAAGPPVAPTINAAATVSLIRALQASYADNISENGDKAQRYLVITAPPDQIKLRRLLGDIIQLALRPNVAVLEPPDPNRELDAPKLPTPDTDGLVTHGMDQFGGVLESVLQQCFVMKRVRADAPAGLGDYYYPNQHPIIVWLAFGAIGSPWKNPSGCNQ